MIAKNYYEALAESLEKKYTSSKLNEAWSESMPDWMKQRLGQIAFNNKIARYPSAWGSSIDFTKAAAALKNNPRFQQYYNDAIMQGSSRETAIYSAVKKLGWEPEYFDNTNPRGASYDEKREAGYDIFRRFKDVFRIDLQTADFIESEPPKSTKHPAMNGKNIPIWYLPDTKQIYAKGINDNEILRVPSEYYGKALKYVPLKELATLCKGNFCYIESNSIDTTTLPQKQTDRLMRNNWEHDNPLLMRGEPGTSETVHVSAPEDPYLTVNATRDKSGYLVVPSAKKYAKIIAKNSAVKKYGKQLSDIEDTLRKYYSILLNAPKLGTWDNPVQLTSLQRSYKSALDLYKELLSTVERILSKYGESSPEFLDYLTSDVSWYTYFGLEHARPFIAQLNLVQSDIGALEYAARDYDYVDLDI